MTTEFIKIKNYIKKTYKFKILDVTKTITPHKYIKDNDHIIANTDKVLVCRRTRRNNNIFSIFIDTCGSADDAIYMVQHGDNIITLDKCDKFFIDKLFTKEVEKCSLCEEIKLDKKGCECGYLLCNDCIHNMDKHDLLQCPQCRKIRLVRNNLLSVECI